MVQQQLFFSMWLEKGPFLERWNLLFWSHVKESDNFVHFSMRRQLVMVIQIPPVWCAKSWRRNGSHESRCCFVPCMEMGRYGKIIHSTEMIWNWFRQNSYDLAIWLCSKAGQLSAETSRIFCDSPSGHWHWSSNVAGFLGWSPDFYSKSLVVSKSWMEMPENWIPLL